MLNKRAKSQELSRTYFDIPDRRRGRDVGSLQELYHRLLLGLGSSSILPFVQHDLLATEQSLAPHLALVCICRSHEFHHTLFDTKTSNLLLAHWVERYELADVVAS